MPWWGWVLLWVVLLVGSALLLAWLGRRVWHSARELLAELERAGELVAELESRADELREVPLAPSAVTQDPLVLREEYRRQRSEQAAERRIRRADRLPPWARVH